MDYNKITEESLNGILDELTKSHKESLENIVMYGSITGDALKSAIFNIKYQEVNRKLKNL